VLDRRARRGLKPDALGGQGGDKPYLRTIAPVPRAWVITMAILVVCLLASMAIAIVKLT
jgi:hypothetical protein